MSSAAATRRVATSHKSAPSGKEDPRHTWNQQLMEACLACDLPRVKELVQRGADPVNAREVPPPSFYLGTLGVAVQEEQHQLALQKHSAEDGLSVNVDASEGHGPEGTIAAAAAATTAGENTAHDSAASATAGGAVSAIPDRLSPLAAMLLSGLNTPAARGVIAFLLERGASVNDTFTFAAARDGTRELDATGGTAGDDASSAQRSTVAETKKAPKKKMSILASRSNSTGQNTGASTGVSDEPKSQHAENEVCVEGSVLHYVVSRGDHAQLLRLLLLAGTELHSRSATPIPVTTNILPQASPLSPDTPEGKSEERGIALPYSLLHSVEQETVVGALRHQQPTPSLPQSIRPMSGSKGSSTAAAAGAAAIEDFAGVGAGAQRGKGKQGGTPAVSAPVSPSHASMPTQEAGADAGDGAPLIVTPSSAESVTAAFLLRQQHDNTAGVRRLPVLLSAYPIRAEDETLSNAGATGLPEKSERGVNAVLRKASASLWCLRQLCSGAVTAPTENGEASSSSNSNNTTINPSQAATTTRPPPHPFSRVQLDMAQLNSHGRPATAIALHHGDMLSFRLLHFFGAPLPFGRVVNATQTRLARACARGDVARVEAFLRQGDRLAQISQDGRYTLIHYAAAHPAVLKVLTDHGLSLEHENVWGETAALSLQRHGTARNEAKYVQTLYATATAVAAGGGPEGALMSNPATSANPSGATPAAGPGSATSPQTAPQSAAVSNAVAFAQMSPSAQRNYILCPPLQLPLLTTTTGSAGGGGGGSGRSGAAKERATSASARRATPTPSTATATNPMSTAGGPAGTAAAAAQPDQPFLGGREAGTWWSFLPPAITTAEVLDTLLKAGAVLQGYIPDDELDLPYVRFAEALASAAAANGDGLRNSEEWEDNEEAEESYASRNSLSGSANTAVPTSHASSTRLKGSLFGRRPPQPSPGRLPLRVTPLQQAIIDYHPELIRRLLMDYRVDPMQRDSQGATALHYAALCTHAPSVLELLVSPQVMLMHMKPSGTAAGGTGAASTALMEASSTGTEVAISIPIAAGSKVDLNSVDMAGRTPLFYAALVGNEHAVRLLLRFGTLAQVGRGDRDGWTPLHVAVRQQHPTVVELLVRHTKQLLSAAGNGGQDLFTDVLASPGSSAGGRRASARGNARRGSHRSGSLNSANRSRRSGSNATNGAAAAPSDLLFANGAVALVDVEAEDRVTHMTALEILIKEMRPQLPASAAQMRMALALLAEGQASSLRPSGLANGGSLLHRVVADGQVELAELLLSYYADPDEVDDADETPLFLALRQPASPPGRVNAAAVPSSTAAAENEQRHRRCRTALVRVLLQYGATPFAQSGVSLETPQHLAAHSLTAPSTDDVEELLQLLFYTAPDRKAAAGAGGWARQRRSDGKSKSREHGVLSRVLDTMEAESSQSARRGSKRSGPPGAGASGTRDSSLRRRLNRNSSEGNRSNRRHSSLEGGGSTSARDRRGQQQRRAGPAASSSPLPASSTAAAGSARSAGGVAGSLRRNMWADELGNAFDAVAPHGDQTAGEQQSFTNSSFASLGANTGVFADEDDVRSAVTSRPDTPDGSTTAMHSGDGDISGGGDGEAEHRRAVLRQWQCADHLLAPSHCWLLTNAQGQTPLHVLCGSACPAVQRFPPVLKLLADLQSLTVLRDTTLAAATTTFTSEAISGDRDVLAMLWSLPDAQGRTPLHAAAQSGFTAAMKIILQLSPTSVVAVDAQGRTALHACVLMAKDSTSSPNCVGDCTHLGDEEEIDAAARADAESEAMEAARLHGIMTALREALTRVSADATAAAVQLVGQPLRQRGRDVLPAPLRTAARTSANATTLMARKTNSAADGDNLGSAVAGLPTHTHSIAALVQQSSITGQLQRWQRSRHWGAPTLMRDADSDHGDKAYLQMDATASDVSSGGSGVRSWKAYAQLPDGQGRTALLLAAEVGNRSAARELLRQA